jgi:hypothetical protein
MSMTNEHIQGFEVSMRMAGTNGCTLTDWNPIWHAKKGEHHGLV